MLSEEYLDRCLDFVTTNPARNLGVEYGIEVGKPASFIVLDASTTGKCSSCTRLSC